MADEIRALGGLLVKDGAADPGGSGEAGGKGVQVLGDRAGGDTELGGKAGGGRGPLNMASSLARVPPRICLVATELVEARATGSPTRGPGRRGPAGRPFRWARPRAGG